MTQDAGQLQAKWRSDPPPYGTPTEGEWYLECERAIIDALAMGGVNAWHGDGVSCAAQIVMAFARQVPPRKERKFPDWPPTISAIGLAEGERRQGSTGQLWEVNNHQWVRARKDRDQKPWWMTWWKESWVDVRTVSDDDLVVMNKNAGSHSQAIAVQTEMIRRNHPCKPQFAHE